MYRLWSEWDFGQEDLVFSTKENVYGWLKSNLNFREFCENNNYTQSELFDKGYLQIQKLTLISNGIY